ncbi:MAG: hypothetical protein H6739_02100 [Alphaproteobacteria bacterium]|nr:hypothetical protein [Alphaproteobacteria bacterium]
MKAGQSALWAGLSAWSLALAVALTWPAARHLNDAALGSPHADGLKHLWTLWRIRQDVLADGHFPFATKLINFPEGMDLYPIEPLNGLWAIFLGFLPIVATANALALLNLTLVGVTGAALGWRLSRSPWGALAAGTLLEGSAVALFTIHVGVGELQHIWWVPLGLVAWHRLRYGPVDVGSWRDAIALGLALTAATISCFYHGFFLGLAVATLSTLTLWAGRASLRLAARYALAAGLAVSLVLPIMSSFSTSYQSEDPPDVGLWSYVTVDHGQPLTDPPSARLELAHTVVPATARRAPEVREIEGYGGGRYLGLPALLLGLLGLVLAPRRAWPWVVTGAVGVVFALGSYLAQGGETVLLSGDRRVQLPFLYLNRMLGYVSEPINFPVRFLAITVTALAACAALAAERLGPRWRPLVAALALVSVLDVQRHQLTSRPMATLTPWSYPQLEPLAEIDGAAIVDFSLAARADVEVRWASMSAQLAHQRPIHGVHIDRVQFFAQEGQRFIQALPLVQELGPALSTGRVDHAPKDLDRRYRPDIAVLRSAGFTHLMVLGIGGSRTVPDALRTTLGQALGEPVIDSAGAMVWELPTVLATADELAAWSAEHEARVRALQAQQAGSFGPQIR